MVTEKPTPTLHFTFGSPQSFVSQARRTRDLWVGSFLLSWLSGHAMHALGEESILMPDVEDDRLMSVIDEIKQGTQVTTKPEIGSLPNRFTADLTQGKSGTDCAETLKTEWQRIADEVLKYLNGQSSPLIGHKQNTIWKRQVTKFWECTWVVSDESFRLDQRKNQRVHLPAAEPGEKCTVCGERQELSGKTDPRNIRKEIGEWWNKSIREKEKLHALDLRENERLCAICLIKRAIATPDVSEAVFHYQIPRFYPSTAYMAAIDWLTGMLQQAEKNNKVRQKADALIDEAGRHLEPKYRVAERDTEIKDIQEASAQSGLKKGLHAKGKYGIDDLDGNVFFVEALRGDDLGLKDAGKEALVRALKDLHAALAETKMPYPKASPFYALLLMDGDGMGKLLAGRSDEERRKISKALAEFSRKVPEIVKNRNGKLIYAGGDDVFALMPVSSAIDCAKACRIAYGQAFQEQAPFVSSKRATISAAINYAHMNTALGVVVRDAHHLLDDIAKARTGRDAIACRVWKRGGPILTWAQPWDVAESGDLIESVKTAFQNNEPDNPDQFSSKFFYKLRELFKLVQDETGNPVMDDAQVRALLIAEYLATREHRWPEDWPQEWIRLCAGERVERVMKLCHRTVRRLRTEQRNGEICDMEEFCSSGYEPDGALLVRFLSQKEV